MKMRVLSEKESVEIRGQSVAYGIPVRFVIGDDTYNIHTGAHDDVYKITYYGYMKETAERIARLTNTKAVYPDLDGNGGKK